LNDNTYDRSNGGDLYRTIIETVKDMITVWDMNLSLIYVSPSVEHILGYSEKEFKHLFNNHGESGFNHVITPNAMNTFRDTITKRIQEYEKLDTSERQRPVELELVRKDGSAIWTETKNSFLRNSDGERTGFFSITRDISERKHTREMLLKSEERYRNILESIEDGYFELDLAGNLTFFNNALCKIVGYSKDELMGMNNKEYTSPKTAQQALKIFKQIYSTGEPATIADYEILRKDGSIRINDMSASLLTDSSGTPVGFRGVTRDITERRTAGLELEKSSEKLERMLEETIQTLAFTVEVRDPYTAGHQQRVAQLASAISRKMGLPSEKAKGVKMAAIIHDVGKIQIPAEILSKPGSLTQDEMALIRTHPEVGSNILKRIEFHWPISEIVLQHHERINGSGYPHGITGREIHMEAKIIAVADVVEAMVSHRPYRSALKETRAIEEISQNKGVLYDTEVVEACLALITEDGFTFNQ